MVKVGGSGGIDGALEDLISFGLLTLVVEGQVCAGVFVDVVVLSNLDESSSDSDVIFLGLVDLRLEGDLNSFEMSSVGSATV